MQRSWGRNVADRFGDQREGSIVRQKWDGEEEQTVTGGEADHMGSQGHCDDFSFPSRWDGNHRRFWADMWCDVTWVLTGSLWLQWDNRPLERGWRRWCSANARAVEVGGSGWVPGIFCRWNGTRQASPLGLCTIFSHPHNHPMKYRKGNWGSERSNSQWVRDSTQAYQSLKPKLFTSHLNTCLVRIPIRKIPRHRVKTVTKLRQ